MHFFPKRHFFQKHRDDKTDQRNAKDKFHLAMLDPTWPMHLTSIDTKVVCREIPPKWPDWGNGAMLLSAAAITNAWDEEHDEKLWYLTSTKNHHCQKNCAEVVVWLASRNLQLAVTLHSSPEDNTKWNFAKCVGVCHRKGAAMMTLRQVIPKGSGVFLDCGKA